jgi:hypothetical protein
LMKSGRSGSCRREALQTAYDEYRYRSHPYDAHTELTKLMQGKFLSFLLRTVSVISVPACRANQKLKGR